MKEVVITSKVVGRGGGSTPVRAGQGSQVDLSDYLLKAIWDEAWELRTDSNGQDYIFGKLPIVTQYGITMYAGDSVDVGTIYDGLPIDGSTIYWENGVLKAKGGTEGDITSITSAMIISALGYTPYDASNPSGYITSSALSGYATQSWVQSLGYATTSDLDSRINALINGAPSAYDTLKEIADILAGNVDSIGDIITTLGTKADKNVTISAGTGLTGGGTLAANRTLSLATSGVTAGTYKSVTVDAYGRVTGGSNPTTLAGYGITDAYTKNEITSLLGNYVTLASEQTITGKKNFTTGGLFVNGSQITYDSTNKYWKLEGDLLVTGGVTMYGNDSEFVPSTIMDAILYDDTTLGINSSGELYVKGSVGGSSTLGGLSNVGSWADSVADVDRIMYQASGSSMWVAKALSSIGLNTTELQNYLTSNGYLNTTSGDSRYLKLSGGTLTGSYYSLTLKNTNQYASLIRFDNSSGELGYIGMASDGEPYIYGKGIGNGRKIWTATNDGSGSGLDADLLDGLHLFSPGSVTGGVACIGADGVMEISSIIDFHANNSDGNDFNTRLYSTGIYKNQVQLPTSSGTLALTTDNVASATKLQTARFIWGQSFDGTGNIDGDIYVCRRSGSVNDDSRIIRLNGVYDPTTNFVQGPSIRALGAIGYGMKRFAIFQHYGNDYISESEVFSILPNGNVGINTPSPSAKLHVSGDILATGGITMYSDQRKKTILKHVELSLKQIANAPLIEHYYNSDDKKTTHVGSIAQYWAGLNDWFCKKDSEGYYTMEIQNAALASAISVARELDRYESKTDKKIKQLKKRICQLEDELERLKSA